jgi:hypothetical protein
MIRTSSEQNYTRNYEVACLLACYYEVRKQRNIDHVSAAFSARFFKVIFRDSCIAMSCLALKTMMQMIRLQLKRKRLLLKLSFVCYFIFYVKFHSTNKLYFSQKRLSGAFPLILTLHLWENLSRITSSELTSPVSELPTLLRCWAGLMYGRTFHGGFFSVDHACVKDVFVASG